MELNAKQRLIAAEQYGWAPKMLKDSGVTPKGGWNSIDMDPSGDGCLLSPADAKKAISKFKANPAYRVTTRGNRTEVSLKNHKDVGMTFDKEDDGEGGDIQDVEVIFFNDEDYKGS